MGALNLQFFSTGQLVCPEDIIVANDVGGCHVARNVVKKILHVAEKRTDNEKDKLECLAAGELGIDTYKISPPLYEACSKYINTRMC